MSPIIFALIVHDLNPPKGNRYTHSPLATSNRGWECPNEEPHLQSKLVRLVYPIKVTSMFIMSLSIHSEITCKESESEMYLFDPYTKCIQSNNGTILDQGTPIKTRLVANIRAAYYIIHLFFHINS